MCDKIAININDTTPFSDLAVESPDWLDSVLGRESCPKCKKSRKYYCYTCYIPMPSIASRLPNVALPLNVHIIKHPLDFDGKSTAIHAAIISPNQVTVYAYPCMPTFKDKSKVLLVFPGEDAVSMVDLIADYKKELVLQQQQNQDQSLHKQPQQLQIQQRQEKCYQSQQEEQQQQQRQEEKQHEQVQHEQQNEHTIICGSREYSTHASKPPDICTSECSDTVLVHKPFMKSNQSPDRLLAKDTGNIPTCCQYSFKRSASPPRKSILHKKHCNCQSVERSSDVALSTACGSKYEHVVFIDSTWRQVKRICTDERLSGIKKVELKTRETHFWRYQNDKPNTYLATIEAIYYFFRDYHEGVMQEDYRGNYDNLLFFFVYYYKMIHKLYDKESIRADRQRSGLPVQWPR